MKYKLKYLIFLFIVLLFPMSAKANDVNIYLFHSQDCSHCKAEIKWLEEIKENYDNVTVQEYEVTRNSDNASLESKVRKQFNTTTPVVPFTVIGEKYFIGFSDDTKSGIIKMIDKYSNEEHRDVVDEVINGIDNGIITNGDKLDDKFTIPIIGEVNAKNVSLPIIAIVIGFVDGFNPCAMWVLIFLISMLMGMKNKKRMWILGLTFLATSALVYVLFMFAWLNIAVSLIEVMWIRYLISIVALVGAFINLKSFYKSVTKKDSGCEVVNDTKRKRIMKYIKKFTAEKHFILALLGVMGLAFAVNLIELACSAGLPLMFTQILALNNLNTIQTIIYVALYILFFLIDDIVVFTVAMFTLQLTGISTKYTKYSHLIGGIIMLLIGLLMIFKPSWLMFNF